MYRLVRKYNLEHLWEDEGAVFDVAAGCNTVPRIRKFCRNFIFRRVQEVEQVKWRLEVIEREVDVKALYIHTQQDTIVKYGEKLWQTKGKSESGEAKVSTVS